jgi:hypothetical protein
MKTCKICLVEKPDEDFRLRKSKNKTPFYISTCKECERERDRKRYNDNVEINREKKRLYKEKIKGPKKEPLTKNEYYHKTKNNPLNIITRATRRRLKKYLTKFEIGKKNKTFDIIGCTPKELKTYIESLFYDGMSWDNYGLFGWHIDHIKPLSSANNLDEMLKLNHYTNLQPLWWKDNLSKGKKVL